MTKLTVAQSLDLLFSNLPLRIEILDTNTVLNFESGVSEFYEVDTSFYDKVLEKSVVSSLNATKEEIVIKGFYYEKNWMLV